MIPIEWKQDTRRRWSLAIGIGFALVAILALLAEQFVERVLGIGYEIHWLETVPIITLLFAWVIQKAWADQAKQAAAGPMTDASAVSEEPPM